MRLNQRVVTCLFKLVAVGCKLLRSQAYWRGVLLLGPYTYRRGVLLYQFRAPSVLVYPQLAAPIPTLILGVERHTPRLVAYRPARYRKGI
jgi:hypothetical protein